LVSVIIYKNILKYMLAQKFLFKNSSRLFRFLSAYQISEPFQIKKDHQKMTLVVIYCGFMMISYYILLINLCASVQICGLKSVTHLCTL